MKKNLNKYFIPNEENDHQPHFLRDSSLKKLLIVSILFELIVLALILPIFNGKLDYLSAVLPSVLVLETNQERESQNLNTLETNALLAAAAQMKANDMAEKGYFAHVTPDGKQPWHFLSEVGYEYETAGENLAVNFVDSKKVHEAWMNSPTHKANILKDKYTEIGIATAKGTYKGREAIFVAQFFGKPKIIVERVETNNFVEETEREDPNPDLEQDDQVAGASVNDSDNINDTDDTGAEESKPETVAVSENELEEDSIVSEKIVNEDLLEENNEKRENIVVSNIDNNNKSLLTKITSSPITFITLVISILLILVALALILKIIIKVKIQYPKMILNTSLVLSVLLSFYFLNALLVDILGETI